jgi:hypothetical protein
MTEEVERQLDRILGRYPDDDCDAVSTDGCRCELPAGHGGLHEECSSSPLRAARRWGTPYRLVGEL